MELPRDYTLISHWPDCSGMVAGIESEYWPDCCRNGGRFPAGIAAGFARNTQLNLKDGLNISKLFFFLTDPGDVSATTTISSDTVSKDINPASNRDKSLWFVGIDAGSDYVSQIVWSVNKTNDGFGLDDFTRVSPVPEPGTLLLIGSGLAGMVLYRRKTNKV